MKYRKLGRTDLKVPVVGLGAWQFGGEWGKEFTQFDVDRILRTAKDLGMNLIDTAECYGDHRSESLIGRAIKGERRDWIIATKFGHKFHANFDRTDHWSPHEVVQQLDASLNALGTDYVDIYQFHSGPDGAFDNPDLWEALNEQVRLGKIGHLGVSIGENDNLHQVQLASDFGIQVVQVVYNRLDRVPENRVFPSCREQNLGVLARVPLASGFLSGKYKPGDEFTDEDDVRSLRDKEEIQRTLEKVREIKESEVPEDVPMATWALAWCLKHPAVTSVIPGCKTTEQVEMNAKAADLEIVRLDHPQAV